VLTVGEAKRSTPEPPRLSLSHRERLERLLETSRELSKIQPLESLMTKIAEACAHLLDSDSVGIRIREEDDLVLAGAYGDALEAMPTARLKMGESLSGTVAATGEPLMISDASQDARMTLAHREAFRRGGYKAFLAVPLMLGPQVLGVLSCRTRRAAGFSLEDLSLAMAFAAQAAIALENSRLYQETQRAYDELSATQEQLTQARKMEAVGRLAGGIAHDFNNLLTVMIGRSQLLLRRLGDEDPVRSDIELMEQTADRAAELTRQLLAFSRKQVLQPTLLDLNAVVANMAEMLGRVIGEDIALVTAFAPGLGLVKADPSQIEQIVVNLIANARDAMEAGGRVTLETANAELDRAYVRHHVDVEPGSYVMLAVSDTGIGMTPDTQARIFEPFFTTKDPGCGTGLGLATVYGIIKQSGGHIWVYSEPGRGTTLKIYLPRAEGTITPSVARPTLPEPARGHETVLLVEDELAVRSLARDVLQAQGYTVIEARDGRHALEICELRFGAIDLLLTDVVMPGIGGRELAARLAELRPAMPVIYMSGYTDTAVVQHGVLDPGTTFLQKPFTPDALARKVRQVLDAVLTAKE